jgi:hypothetical protein
MAVFETLQAVIAAVMEPRSNTTTENCDEELKTPPPKTCTASKRTLSTEKEMQEKKRWTNRSSPMMYEGRFEPVLQAHLDEMQEPKEYETSEHEDYAAERDELGFEDGTDMKYDGSETSQKVTGAIDTAAWLSELRQQADELR